jgi:hypothetical protein
MPLWLKKIFTTEDTEVHGDARGKMKRTFYCWSEWRGMLALWLKKTFTTEDTEVHGDAQGEMKRTFTGGNEEDLL